MEIIKKLFDKNTNLGRGVRTAFQGLLALITFIYGFLLIPGLYDLLASNDLATVASFATLVGVISYVQNALESIWERVR